MGTEFNADEVLGMAVEIERNGKGFYTFASQQAEDDRAKSFLAELAEWEAGHEELFDEMRQHLSSEETERTAFDPYDELEMYIKTMADEHVFNLNSDDPGRILGGSKSLDDMIEVALQFERDSILFFTGLKHMVPERLGRDKVQKVIDEEISHIAYLQKKRCELC